MRLGEDSDEETSAFFVSGGYGMVNNEHVQHVQMAFGQQDNSERFQTPLLRGSLGPEGSGERGLCRHSKGVLS